MAGEPQGYHTNKFIVIPALLFKQNHILSESQRGMTAVGDLEMYFSQHQSLTCRDRLSVSFSP
jgi:hypothetical protein